MFNFPYITRGLSFTKIISGISKSLQIANQLIPLYEKARPAITNAGKLLKTFKEINTPSKTKITKEENKKTLESTSPTFFL
jgi:hypothetical protein